MTKVIVDPGICGFPATIEVTATSDHTARVTITSDCEKAVKAGELLKEVDWFSLLRKQGETYPAYQDAVLDMKHISCPIPVAILKAVEAELGFALPKDVSFHFQKEPSSE
ncbi:hypothetical protein ES703_67942 [subsurface metagenome]|jgi:hypothetical protein